MNIFNLRMTYKVCGVHTLPTLRGILHGSIPVLHQQNVTSGQTVENNQNANHEHIQDMSLFVLP